MYSPALGITSSRALGPRIRQVTVRPDPPSSFSRPELGALGRTAHPPRLEDGPRQIPWSDPAFSARMLEVHLDPTTHMASRQPAVIGQHCDWLSTRLTDRDLTPDRCHILDVGCGPGLYLLDLAARGFRTTGFDFAPAPLAWAREEATRLGLDCRFEEWDLTRLPDDLARQIGPVDAITFWFGEFNSFSPENVREFLPRLAGCLRPGGLLFLEYQPWDVFVQEDATQWSWEERSVFLDAPHLWLQEFGWDAEHQAEIHAHWIIPRDSGKLMRYQQCHFAWQDSELVAALEQAGLTDPEFHAPIAGVEEEFEFPLLVARRGHS